MQLPHGRASAEQRVAFGRYVEQRLRLAKLAELAAGMKAVTDRVKQAGRDWEDAGEPVQRALADREAADLDLDEAAQESRLALASRGVSAMHESPYTEIFPHGLDYYTAAPIDEEAKRYGELMERLAAHLPAGDAVREAALPRIDSGIAAFRTARESVDKARTAEALARTALTAAEEAFDDVAEKTYGALINRFGKQKAETFFPRRRRKGGPDDSGGSSTPA